MTLPEALKTGKTQVRRKNHPHYCGSDGTGYVDIHHLVGCCGSLSRLAGYDCAKIHLSVQDLKADDWEVMTPSVTITRAQLENAWNKSQQALYADWKAIEFKALAKALGLDE